MSIKRIEFLVKSCWMKNAMIETGRLVAKHTCQLFYVTGETFEPRGSGVLFQHDGRYFLLSAGHVLKCLLSNKNPDRPLLIEMGIPNGKELIMVSGQLDVNDEDHIDIGLMELQKEVVEDLNDYYSFLTIDNVGIGHIGVATMQYVISGFPIENTKGRRNPIDIKTKPIHLSTLIVPQPSMGELPKWQVAYAYNRLAAIDSHTGNRIIGPEAIGVSGGGAWFVEVDDTGSLTHNYKLAGIAVQHPDGTANVIVTTKVDLFTETLRQKFGLNIPKSHLIKVNLLT